MHPRAHLLPALLLACTPGPTPVTYTVESPVTPAPGEAQPAPPILVTYPFDLVPE